MIPVSSQELQEVAQKLSAAKQSLVTSAELLSELHSYMQERYLGFDEKIDAEIKKLCGDCSAASFLINVQRYQVLQFSERILSKNGVDAATHDCEQM